MVELSLQTFYQNWKLKTLSGRKNIKYLNYPFSLFIGGFDDILYFLSLDYISEIILYIYPRSKK